MKSKKQIKKINFWSQLITREDTDQRISVSNIFLVTATSFGAGPADGPPPADPFWRRSEGLCPAPTVPDALPLVLPLAGLLARFFNEPWTVELSATRPTRGIWTLPRATLPLPALAGMLMVAALAARLLSEPVFFRSLLRNPRGICPLLSCWRRVYCSCSWRCFLSNSWCLCSSNSCRDCAKRFSISAAVAAAELPHLAANIAMLSRSIVPASRRSQRKN